MQAKTLKNSQEVEFTNKITGKNIAKFSNSGIYKPSIQAKILQNSQEVEFINQNYRQKYCKISKRHRCLFTQHIIINMNQLRMRRGRTGEISASTLRTETIVWNRCSNQVPEIVGTNDYTNKKHEFYNLTVQAILRGGVDFATKF